MGKCKLEVVLPKYSSVSLFISSKENRFGRLDRLMLTGAGHYRNKEFN
jgi:hypothetical protein